MIPPRWQSPPPKVKFWIRHCYLEHYGVAWAFLKLRTVKDSVEGDSGGPSPANFECISQICAILANFSVQLKKFIRYKTLLILTFFLCVWRMEIVNSSYSYYKRNFGYTRGRTRTVALFTALMYGTVRTFIPSEVGSRFQY